MGITLDLLRPSAVSGLIRLRRELAKYPDRSVDEVCRLLSATYASSGLDYQSAVLLHEVIPELPEDISGAYRIVISTLVAATNPSWLGLFRRGRQAVFDVVGMDIRTCFERAGALERVPCSDVVGWLDGLVGEAYAQNNAQLLQRGREAELLSFQHETARLAGVAGAPHVEWVSLDDNSIGFDIRSASQTEDGFRPRFIEVKSSQSNPPVIFITRHEWNVAKRMGDLYCFHIWHLPTLAMCEISLTAMSSHIPDDNGLGAWDSVKIVFEETCSWQSTTTDL